MAAIPTLGEEDARRPNRERENLLGERTRIVNRVKASLVRFGVRNFNPTLRKAPERLEALRTPEGGPLPPNSFAELRRDMVRLRFVMGQIKEIEETRLQRLENTPNEGSHAMVRLLARAIGVGIERQTCSCTRYCRATYGIKERSLVTPVSPALQTKVAGGHGKKVSPELAMPASGEA